MKEAVGVVGVSRAGLDYAAVDGDPVHVILMVISPPNKADQHLDIIRWIARIARHPDCVRFMLTSETPELIRENLEELGG